MSGVDGTEDGTTAAQDAATEQDSPTEVGTDLEADDGSAPTPEPDQADGADGADGAEPAPSSPPTADRSTAPRAPDAAARQQRRREAVDAARTASEAEGHVSPEPVRALQEAFVRGELDIHELIHRTTTGESAR